VIVQKKYVLLMLLTAYRAAEFRRNFFKDNIEMEIIVMAHVIARYENNWIKIYNYKIPFISRDIWK